MFYYSVYIPLKIDEHADNTDRPLVFTEVGEALKILKKHKDARLKMFKENEDAIKFSLEGFKNTVGGSHAAPAGLSSPALAMTLEKAAFRGPTKQELVKFRKCIEEGNYDEVRKKIWDNPRYLISSGDTPACLKEGTRYNALHVCAISKRPEIAELILATISDLDFVERMQGSRNWRRCKEFRDVLLDYYLNMPEKGRSDTPLHLAAKYGAAEVVEVLMGYPQCKMLENLEKMLPKDIVCSRMNNPSRELKEKIYSLLDDRFYVPVIRSKDHSTSPTVGQPFLHTKPPELNTDPLSPTVEIQAYAGPMNKERANIFRQRWKTPPRTKSPVPLSLTGLSPFASYRKTLSTSTPIKQLNNNFATPRNLNLDPAFRTLNDSQDTQNGNIPLLLSNELPSEDAILNNHETSSDSKQLAFPISTPLRIFTNKKHLLWAYRDMPVSPLTASDDSIRTSNDTDPSINDLRTGEWAAELDLKLTDAEKGLEVVGRGLARQEKIEWHEFWDFLGCFIDIASTEGLQKLENYLQSQDEKRHQIGEMTAGEDVGMSTTDESSNSDQLVNCLCQAMQNLDLLKDEKVYQSRRREHLNSNTPQLSQETQPYLCVEKSIQVFAKRMTKAIVTYLDNITSINEAFNSELKRVKSLVCSFKDDQRFKDAVNFSFVHSRFVNLICGYLQENETVNEDTVQTIKKCFEQILETKSRKLSCFEGTEQLLCIANMFIRKLQDEKRDRIIPENLKTEKTCMETWLQEEKCVCCWEQIQTIKQHIISRHINRSKRLENDSMILPESESTAAETFPCQKQADGTSQSDDSKGLNDLDEYFSYSDESDNENDIFLSVSETDYSQDEFFTPPESPKILETDISDENLEPYNIFLLGDTPLKRDFDVINALYSVEIDRKLYPKIYRWKQAVLRFPSDNDDNLSPQKFHRKLYFDAKKNQTLSTPMSQYYMIKSESPMDRSGISSEFSEKFLFRNKFFSKTPPTAPEGDSPSVDFMDISDM